MFESRAHVVDLEPGEVVVHEVRRHMFVFYIGVSIIVLFALMPLIFSPVLSQLLDIVFIGSGAVVFLVVYLFWFLILYIFFFFRWTDYYLDVWVITNKRVFDIEQKGM